MTKKRVLFWSAGILLAAFAACSMVLFTTCEVKSVEVRGNTRYSDEEVKSMVLKGPFANNSILAPLLCKNDGARDTYLVDGWSVTRLSRDSIAINFDEKKPVGCIRYLDSYVYFDRNGVFVDASLSREEEIPYFNGISAKQVVMDEKLPVKGTEVLGTAVTLATIFQKDDRLPDYVRFDDKNQVDLVYGDVTVSLGKNENLEDKIARVLAILPLIEDKEGILHVESVTENSKLITFEAAGAGTAQTPDGSSIDSYFHDSELETEITGDDPAYEDSEETAGSETEETDSGEEMYRDDYPEESYSEEPYSEESYSDESYYDDAYSGDYDSGDIYGENEYQGEGGIYDESYYDALYEGIYW